MTSNIGHRADGLSWSTVVAEINANRPFQSHVPNHVRVAKGYKDLVFWKYVAINDPWPTGQGDSHWEGYDSLYWTGTILVYNQPVAP